MRGEKFPLRAGHLHSAAVTRQAEPVVLCVGGLDPTGGAGVLADIRALAAVRARGAAVLTALTRQRPVGPVEIEAREAKDVATELATALADLTPRAVKVGMLGSAEVANAVAEALAAVAGRIPVIVDPVLAAGAGGALAKAGVLEVLRERLTPLATILTPNLDEAARLTGLEVGDVAAMEEAGRWLRAAGARSVLVKGGHLPGRPVDVLVEEERVWRWPGRRHAGPEVHGTGCTLASLIAGQMAHGTAAPEAARRGIVRLRRAIAVAWAPQKDGWAFLGPLI